MLFFLSIYLIGVLGSLVHIYLVPKEERTTARVVELLLLYQLVFSVGITSFLAFIGFTFLDQYIAEYLNWPASPFEQEMANVNLAFAVLGILCIWYRNLFWMATVIGFSVWILADGIHHVHQLVYMHNYSDGNMGVPLYTDLIVPIVLLILLYFYQRTFYKEAL